MGAAFFCFSWGFISFFQAIRASMGAVFKLPYTFAPHWPEAVSQPAARRGCGRRLFTPHSCEQALSQVKAGGYGLLALHLQGSVEHTAALGANGTAARRRSLVQPRAASGSLATSHWTGVGAGTGPSPGRRVGRRPAATPRRAAGGGGWGGV